MPFRKKQSAKVMIPARWDPDGPAAELFYKIKEELQARNPDHTITNDAVIEYCLKAGFRALRESESSS